MDSARAIQDLNIHHSLEGFEAGTVNPEEETLIFLSII